MYHFPHLIHVFFFCRYEKGLLTAVLNFVNEKVKLVYKINTRLAFQTSKTTIYNKQATNFRIKVHIQISIIVSLEEL